MQMFWLKLNPSIVQVLGDHTKMAMSSSTLWQQMTENFPKQYWNLNHKKWCLTSVLSVFLLYFSANLLAIPLPCIDFIFGLDQHAQAVVILVLPSRHLMFKRSIISPLLNVLFIGVENPFPEISGMAPHVLLAILGQVSIPKLQIRFYNKLLGCPLPGSCCFPLTSFNFDIVPLSVEKITSR